MKEVFVGDAVQILSLAKQRKNLANGERDGTSPQTGIWEVYQVI